MRRDWDRITSSWFMKINGHLPFVIFILYCKVQEKGNEGLPGFLRAVVTFLEARPLAQQVLEAILLPLHISRWLLHTSSFHSFCCTPYTLGEIGHSSRYPRRPLPVILCDFVWYFSAVSLVATSAFLTCRELYSSHHRRVISEDRKQAHVSALRSSVEKYLTAEHRALLRQELEPELHDFEEAGAKLTFWPDLFKHDHHALLFFLVANRCAEEAEGLGADDDVTELTKALFFHLETYFFEQHKAALISPCELFGRAVCAIIGAVVKYLIPLPSLRHLERPFRPRILFFFLLSFPGILILRRLWMRFAAAYVPLDMLRNAPLLVDSLIKAVHLFSPLTLSRNLDLEEAKKAIVPWYEAAAPNPNFPRLEEEVHEAILNAILQWKATKEEAKKNKTEGEAVE